MKKIFTITALALLAVSNVRAQAPYTLSNYTQPYEPLTHAVSADGGTVWGATEIFYPMYMPFTAKVGATTVNKLYTDGGVTYTDTMGTDVDIFQWVFTPTTDRGAGTTHSKSPLRYITSGTAPNRIFKIESYNMGFLDEQALFGTLNDYFSCQLWIYESSNILEMHFGDSKITHAADYFGSFAVASDSPAFVGYGSVNFSAGLFNFGWFPAGNPEHPYLNAFNSTTPGYPTYTKPLWHWPASGTVYRYTPVGKVTMCHHGSTIFVDAADIAGHLAHGDYMGSCHKSCARSAASGGETEIDASNGIQVYPNPTENIFNVVIPATGKDIQVVITDLTGRIIESRNVADYDGQPVQFSLNNAARGIYVIKVFAGETSYVEKIIAR